MKNWDTKKSLQVFFLALSFFSLAGMGSCSMSTAEVCNDHLPEFEQQLSAAMAALSPWDTTSRQPASEMSRLATVDREVWLKWAEDHLVEAQHYIDVVEGGTVQELVREEISGIATDLVSFHGYAKQGKGERMVRTLERIQAHSSRARELACPREKIAAKSSENKG